MKHVLQHLRHKISNIAENIDKCKDKQMKEKSMLNKRIEENQEKKVSI